MISSWLPLLLLYVLLLLFVMVLTHSNNAAEPPKNKYVFSSPSMYEFENSDTPCNNTNTKLPFFIHPSLPPTPAHSSLPPSLSFERIAPARLRERTREGMTVAAWSFPC